MKQHTFASTKVASDMFFAQMKWSLWFLLFIVLAHIAVIILSGNLDQTMGDFLLFSHGSSKIYMLVIGIFSSYAFLTYYVNHGVTRRDYFKGSVVASAGIALSIVVIAAMLTGLEYIILGLADLPVTVYPSMLGNVKEGFNNSISTIMPEDVLGSSILVHSSSWLASLVMYWLSILSYYVIGWLIGIGFYRYGWLIGLGFVTVSLMLITLTDMLWGTELDEPLSYWMPFDTIQLPFYGAVIGNIILIGIILFLIRLITRKVTIKM